MKDICYLPNKPWPRRIGGMMFVPTHLIDESPMLWSALAELERLERDPAAPTSSNKDDEPSDNLSCQPHKIPKK